MKKILISGDSWGCGEWGEEGTHYGVLHTGLEQYLSDTGFNVTNISNGGFSNTGSIDQIKIKLANDHYDHIVWFQSDPYRDLRPYDKFYTQLQNYDDFKAIGLRLLNKSYAQLNQLNTKIICLGGCTKLDQNIKNYSNLIPSVTSIIELLIPEFNAPEIWMSEWGRLLDQQIPVEVLNQLAVNKRLQDKLFEFPKLFYPDGRHPNRHGYLILYDFIKGEFLNESN